MIVTDFINIIKNNATVQGLLGKNLADSKQRVYPVIVPSLENMPFISVHQSGEDPVNCKSGAPQESFVSITVRCFHSSYDDVTNLERAVYNVLIRATGGSIEDIEFITRRDDFVPKDNYTAFVKETIYRCYYENPIT